MWKKGNKKPLNRNHSTIFLCIYVRGVQTTTVRATNTTHIKNNQTNFNWQPEDKLKALFHAFFTPHFIRSFYIAYLFFMAQYEYDVIFRRWGIYNGQIDQVSCCFLCRNWLKEWSNRKYVNVEKSASQGWFRKVYGFLHFMRYALKIIHKCAHGTFIISSSITRDRAFSMWN